jgi:hypothetical protein
MHSYQKPKLGLRKQYMQVTGRESPSVMRKHPTVRIAPTSSYTARKDALEIWIVTGTMRTIHDIRLEILHMIRLFNTGLAQQALPSAVTKK